MSFSVFILHERAQFVFRATNTRWQVQSVEHRETTQRNLNSIHFRKKIIISNRFMVHKEIYKNIKQVKLG